MYKESLYKKILTLMMALMLTIGFGTSLMAVPAYAVGETTGNEEVDKKAAVEEYIKANTKKDNNGNIKFTSGMVSSYASTKQEGSKTEPITLEDGTTIYYNPAGVNSLYSQSEKFKNNSQATQKLDDITNTLTVEADTTSASVMLSGFQPIVELVVGIIVVLIAFGMTIFSGLDICYIAFPVFRNKCEDAKQSGNAMMTKKSANGETSLRWISDDAQYAITQGTIDSGKNPWMLYFRKRIITYIMLGILIFILLTGNITLITRLAMKLVAGIIDVISSLAS